MAKRTYKSITSFLSYKYFDRRSRNYWKERYKKRTGKDTARGWNYSSEYKSYLDSISDRIIKFAERNPVQFFEKKDYILRNSTLEASKKIPFSDPTRAALDYLNPMVGEWGVTVLMKQAINRALIEGKKLTKIARIDASKELLPDSPIVITTLKQSREVRNEMMKNYGNNVAKSLEKGQYDLIGANYSIQFFGNWKRLLGLIEAEIFLY